MAKSHPGRPDLESRIDVRRDAESGKHEVVELFYESGRNQVVDCHFLEDFDEEGDALRHAAYVHKSFTETK